MPRSPIRRRREYTPPAPKVPRVPGTSGRWVAPSMVVLLLLGLLWIIVYYVSQTLYPIPNIGGWNIVVGFGIAMVGFFMTTGWK